MHRATANSGTYDTEREEALSVENAAKNDSDWIRSVVARASTLRERIESGYYIPVAEEGGKERLDRWKELLGIEEQEQWEERLKMSGWTPESVLPLLGSVALKEDAPLPEWGNLLISLLDKPSIPERDIYSDPSVWGVDPDEPLPSRSFFFPLLLMASSFSVNILPATLRLLWTFFPHLLCMICGENFSRNSPIYVAGHSWRSLPLHVPLHRTCFSP